MALTYVKSIQTSDGKLFSDKSEALMHEGMISFRALIHKSPLAQMNAMNSTSVAQFIASNCTEVHKILTKLKDDLRRANKSKEFEKIRL